MRFWCHWNKLTNHCSDLLRSMYKLVIKRRWNKLIKTDETKRNEMRISRSCWECNKSKNRKFCWWFWMIVCWFDNLMWNCCCVWFLSYFLSSDVSTFQENDYCKNHSKIDELTDSKKHEDRLLTKCRLISTNKKID